MKKLFLTLVTALLCNVVSFAQFAGGGTEGDPYLISTKAQFEDFVSFVQQSSGASGKYFKQTADINLGDRGTIGDAIISTEFKGTYDGADYTITYQAHFNGTTAYGDYGLFSTVSGTIKNLNVDADVTMSGTANDMQVALLCGYLTSSGTIQSCNVSGNVNSTVHAGNGGGTDAGLVVGQCNGGTIKYCNAIGNVTGVGYVGGVVGQMSGSSDVLGCSFVGSVTALSPENTFLGTEGSFAGGICGMASDNSSVDLCYVKADITGVKDAQGTTCSATILGKNRGKADVTNCYVEGTINGSPIDSDSEIADNRGTIENNYYEGEIIQSCTSPKTNADCIAEKLNAAVSNSSAVPNEDKDKIHFSVSDDDNVIFGQVSTESVCEAPTNLTITNNGGTYTATWERANADNTITEATWHWELTVGNAYYNGGDAYYNGGDASSVSVSVNLGTLPASPNPYTFTVYTDCSDTEDSQSVSSTFTVDCPAPTALTASNITDTCFTIFWTANVDCQLTVNGIDYEIVAGNPMEKTITGLEPETQYTAIVKAKCGNDYVEQASINVTTARLAAPTGLTVTPTWQSESGKIVVTWDTVPGLTYEYEIYGALGDTVSGPAVFRFQKTGLSEGAYTLKLRAKKGEKTSEWVSMPYTISNPEAPKNPEVTYDQQEGSFKVTIEWEQGVEGEVTWFVAENTADLDGDLISNPYVLTNQQAGETFSILIKEKSNNGQNVSQALVVPIQVPCLDASRPTSIVPALNSVTFNFEVAKTRKIVIGMQDTTTNATSVTINGLTEGTSYACEIREYCNVATNTYSSIDTTFSTLACYAVAGLSVSNIELTTATVSWTSQSSIDGLQYKVVVNEIEKPVQPNTTITLTGLTPATTYTVRVSEQCGTEGNWGEERTITFTTESSNYVTANDGAFDSPDTWEGNKVPTGKFGNITIKHNVKLSHSLTLSGSCRISNEGVLKITSQGELINTTGNNVGGIIEVETPYKTIDQWTFIGAPFADYQLEAVKPVSGSDIAMVKYNYTNGAWNSNWATINTPMEAAEGTFAWPFYGGVVTFTTYGDVINNAYDYSQSPKYALNNDTVKVTKTIQKYTANGYWMALSNPYPAKLSVSKFLTPNTSVLQGGCTYSFNGSSFDIDDATSGNIGMTEGFFVNCQTTGSNTITFTKAQMTNYPSNPVNPTKASSNEFIELTLQNGKDKVRVYFAQNEDAEQGYDILDANKMFATTGVAEPYFVTDGIALIKEEVRDLPYYATMNVRSQEDTVMNFVLTNLPEGYAVSIIDGEEVIDLVEGGVYSTEIASGENADRFKVLVKKNVGLADVEELDVRITNSNRHITITAQENVRTEVYNTLGQKVFETEETNFVLSGVASGAYVVKVQGAKASKSQKIVVE